MVAYESCAVKGDTLQEVQQKQVQKPLAQILTHKTGSSSSKCAY